MFATQAGSTSGRVVSLSIAFALVSGLAMADFAQASPSEHASKNGYLHNNAHYHEHDDEDAHEHGHYDEAGSEGIFEKELNDISTQAISGNGCEDTSTNAIMHPLGQWIPWKGWSASATYPGNQQRLIISSDPQAFRYMSSRSPYAEKINKNEWAKRTQVYDAIKKERQEDYYVPVVVNGDITDYGHGGERRAVQKMLARMAGRIPGPIFFPGLGNHDYSNNVNDCANNGCARDATCDHIQWVSKINPKNGFDYSYTNSTHKGSLSYSVTVGNVHIIQLNNEPTYTRAWSTGGGASFKPKRHFRIESSMDWLAKDLQQARSQGRQIIINMHKPNDWQNNSVRSSAFRQLIEQYDVAAVFAGHYHNSLGPAGSIGKVPVYQSGGLLAGSYLRVTFDWTNNKMLVNTVTMDNSKNTQTVVNLPKVKKPEAGVKPVPISDLLRER